MSTAYNTTPVTLTQNNNTNSNQYFNNYFAKPATISANKNDAVTAFFEEQTNGNKDSAAILASTVIYTALSQGMDPMDIIRQFQNLKPGELNLYLAMFLNLNRVGTSLVGINNQPVQNKYITRAILS